MRIVLGIYADGWFMEGILRGIASHARQGRRPHLERIAPTREGIKKILGAQKDGLLLAANDPEIVTLFEQSPVPVVRVGEYVASATVHQVLTNEMALAEMALTHFTARGYRHFGATVLRGCHPDIRLHKFRSLAQARGFDCSTFERPGVPSVIEEGSDYARDLGEWLRQLPKPLGVFCIQDAHAVSVLRIAQSLGFQVPEEVAVLGVDNNEALCLLSDIHLSSIAPATESIGFEAMQLLQAQIRNREAQGRTLLVPPLQVVERQSTDSVAVADPLVASALALMRTHVAPPISIESICSLLKCSRRNLERRFRLSLSYTPAQAQAGFRIEEARRLLSNTQLKVEHVAEKTGFGDGRLLASSFRKATGLSPSAFRNLTQPNLRPPRKLGDP